MARVIADSKDLPEGCHDKQFFERIFFMKQGLLGLLPLLALAIVVTIGCQASADPSTAAAEKGTAVKFEVTGMT